MSTPESYEALRRANPRRRPHFSRSVAAAADAVDARIAADAGGQRPHRAVRRRPAAAAVAAVAAVATVYLAGSLGGGSEVESATAAVRKAAVVSAAAADRSGSAVVRITHDGEPWARTTIRWHGDDLSFASGAPNRVRKAGSEVRVVDGEMYGIDPVDGAWVELGPVESIDPDSGTTPTEYLAAVREDVGGVTLRRLTRGMSGPTTRRLDNGSVVYSGDVAAGLIARETGFKEGRAIRVFPFGYVAHGAAANPESRLAVALTVDADGLVRNVTVTWSSWIYSVTYDELGRTPAPVAPANARPLRREVRP